MPRKPKQSPDKEILKTFEAGGLVEYMEYLQSPKRILLTNLNAGIAKGLGLSIGMSVVFGLAAWVLTMMVQLPFVGDWAQAAEDYIEAYQESTNYSDEFKEMNDLLKQINANTKGSEILPPGATEAATPAVLATETKSNNDQYVKCCSGLRKIWRNTGKQSNCLCPSCVVLAQSKLGGTTVRC